MPMQMWLTRPSEFEQLDQAINNACCNDDIERLESWVQTLEAVVTGGSLTGIGNATGVFPGPGQAHFSQHWVGNFSTGQPPDYWPYAWGKPAEWNPSGTQPDNRLRLDRLLSFGLQWSIRKVIGARQMVDASTDEWNDPACSNCRTHVTVWVCAELSECEVQLAAADLDFRRSAFRVGVIEARDAVVLVIKTPRPIELTGGVCDPTKVTMGGPEELYKEPVIVTEAFTANEVPQWTQPITNAPTVLGQGTIHEVEQRQLPSGGHMPQGTYPDVNVENCTFVPMPVSLGDLRAPTTSELIKDILRGAAKEEGYRVPGRLDLSEELIGRLRITIADESPAPPAK
ncbi:MAG TPA: hypothetical protein VEP49_03115 [Acidimicrobiia bacterium]|nr:hypothetical protein [Acidimicrobiia bacterium]